MFERKIIIKRENLIKSISDFKSFKNSLNLRYLVRAYAHVCIYKEMFLIKLIDNFFL